MAFSKAVLIVVFAVLLISAEVSALRDLAETQTAPTTHGRGGLNIGVIGGPVNCSNPKFNRQCHTYKNGGKGRGAPGPEVRN